MKNSILFLLFFVLFSCEKEESLELPNVVESEQQGTARGGLGTFPPTGCPVGDPNSSFRLSPYVEQAGICNGLYHTGYEYETVVYAGSAKPYTRLVTVFGWRNGNRSSIPNTYSLTIPANDYASNRVNTFPFAHIRYSSILMEVSSVLKHTSAGWVEETDYRATCASIPVDNCYEETLPCHLTNTCDDDGPATIF